MKRTITNHNFYISNKMRFFLCFESKQFFVCVFLLMCCFLSCVWQHSTLREIQVENERFNRSKKMSIDTTFQIDTKIWIRILIFLFFFITNVLYVLWCAAFIVLKTCINVFIFLWVFTSSHLSAFSFSIFTRDKIAYTNITHTRARTHNQLYFNFFLLLLPFSLSFFLNSYFRMSAVLTTL